MSDHPPRPSKGPKPSKAPPREPGASARSGQHPAVQGFRKKLESIAEGTLSAATKLDQDLEQFLAELQSSRPPPPESEEPPSSKG